MISYLTVNTNIGLLFTLIKFIMFKQEPCTSQKCPNFLSSIPPASFCFARNIEKNLLMIS